jgi:hypothetical protein
VAGILREFWQKGVRKAEKLLENEKIFYLFQGY